MKENQDQFKEIDKHKDSIYVLQHDLTQMVPQHTHKQGHLLVVKDGVARVEVEGSAYYIPYGHFVWIPEDVSHRISFDVKKITLFNIYFPPHYNKHSFFKSVGVYSIPSLLYSTFELVQENTASFSASDWQYKLLSTLQEILPSIVTHNKFQLRLPISNHPIAQKTLSIIQKRFDTPITAQEVAQEMGMSVRTLSRYMRSELGTTFVEYIRIYRIITAINFLVKGECNVSTVAYRVGYDSLTAFSNTFYRITGCRPSQFIAKQ